MTKEILFERRVLGVDDVGRLAWDAYVACLARGHVTASDGTLPLDDYTIAAQLLVGMACNRSDAAAVRDRLLRSGLLVHYATENGIQYCFVAKWFRYQFRMSRAVRAAKNPPVPMAVLKEHPRFAEGYLDLFGPGEHPRNQNKRRIAPNVTRHLEGVQVREQVREQERERVEEEVCVVEQEEEDMP